MSSSTLQFIVAGALIAAWAWMLGRPILTNLFRRSRRDSVGHFRYQQAVLGRPLDGEPFARRSAFDGLLQPLRDWRDQSLERRRLQVMLGFAFATFASLLLAIALRGAAIRLFMVMTVSFVGYLGYAASVGAAQLRRLEATTGRARSRSGSIGRNRRQQQRSTPAVTLVADDGFDTDLSVDGRSIDEEYGADHEDGFDTDYDGAEYDGPDEFDRSVAVAEADPFDGSDGFGTGAFEDEFFEPIPELQFAPLNLDASLIKPESVDASADGVFGEERDPAASMVEFERDQVDLDDVAGDDTFEDGVFEDDLFDLDEAEHDVVVAESVETEAEDRVAFTTPPQPRPRPARKKARPIYIESQLDEADDSRRVVND